MDVTTILIGLAILLILCFYFWRHDSRLPPCPRWPVPLFGHLLYMDKNPRKQFKEWRKKCGDIYSLYLGQNLVVVLNGYEFVKEALVKQGDLTLDRPFFFFDAACGRVGTGLVFSCGQVWKEHRAVTVNILRTLGMGKNILVERIAEAVAENNEFLAQSKGKPLCIDKVLCTATANIIMSITVGETFHHEDESFLKCCKALRDNIQEGDGSNLANYFNFWPYIPGDLFGAKRIRERTNFFMTTVVDRFVQQKGFDEYDENNLDTVISLYMHEMKRKKQAGEPTTMSIEHLNKIIWDLFGGGTETTNTTVKWCILYLMHRPDIEEKIYREIKRVVGTERVPTMADKNNLPYLNAFIKEVQRLGSIVPLNVLRLSTGDLKIGGYTLPKGTQIMASLDSVFFDKKTWGDDVYELKPERFLDENGKVTTPEWFVPFSMGKRMCPGEAMGIVELFLFVSSMVQRFKFLPETPGILPNLTPMFGLTASPAPFNVRAIERKTLG